VEEKKKKTEEGKEAVEEDRLRLLQKKKRLRAVSKAAVARGVKLRPRRQDSSLLEGICLGQFITVRASALQKKIT
jgi:hypothetical protein